MTISLSYVRRRFAQAVVFLNRAAGGKVITLENEQRFPVIAASWIYVETKTLLSNASATYLPKPGEEPDLQIKGDLPPGPPSGWTPPGLIRLKDEEILASNHIIEEECPWLKPEDSLKSVFDHTPSKGTEKSSSSKMKRIKMAARKTVPFDRKRLLLNASTPSSSNSNRNNRQARKRADSNLSSIPQTRKAVSDVPRSEISQSELQSQMTPGVTVAAKNAILRPRISAIDLVRTQKQDTPTTPSNPRRSNRLAGAQSPTKGSEVASKRSISPSSPESNKRPKLSTSLGDKHGALRDPEIPGLPWSTLTSTMQERAIGYLNRNRIHRQPQAHCERCIQQKAARDRVGEDCIAMFDSQGGSIACFRCGYRQLTCSFANGSLIPETPLEIEPSESSQSETVQTTTGSDSVTKDITDQSRESISGNSKRTSKKAERMVLHSPSAPVNASAPSPEPPDLPPDVTDKSQESIPKISAKTPKRSTRRELIHSRSAPVHATAPSPDPPDPHPDKSPTGRERESLTRDVELVESQIEVIGTSPETRPSLVDNEIPSNDGSVSLASVLRENPTPGRRSALRTYSRNDRTTLPPENEPDVADADNLYTLRPAFSPDQANLRNADDDIGPSTSTHALRSCSLRELPQPATSDDIHDSVHRFRAALHTHQSIIKMRHHIFSLLHANDSALRHSRTSLLNATAELKQYPFPWDIPDDTPFDGLKELGDNLVCAWTNGFKAETAFESIQKYDRSQLEVDRHAPDPVEEKLESYYYPNVATVWSVEGGDGLE